MGEDDSSGERLLQKSPMIENRTGRKGGGICFIATIVFNVMLCALVILYTVISSRLPGHANCNSTASAATVPYTFGDCGQTVEEAKAKGCSFDIMSFSWLPPACFDRELTEEFGRLRPWKWHLDPDSAQAAPQEKVYRGDYDVLYVTHEYHIYHCTYMWRKLHRAIRDKRPLDSYIANYNHTAHCEMMLAKQVPKDETDTAIISKLVACVDL